MERRRGDLLDENGQVDETGERVHNSNTKDTKDAKEKRKTSRSAGFSLLLAFAG
jgi:hypothetical protein